MSFAIRLLRSTNGLRSSLLWSTNGLRSTKILVYPHIELLTSTHCVHPRKLFQTLEGLSGHEDNPKEGDKSGGKNSRGGGKREQAMKEGVTESNVGDSGSGGGGSSRGNGWQKLSIALGGLAVAVIGYLFTQSADFMERRFARRIAKSRVYSEAKKGFPPLLPRREVVDRIKKRLADGPGSDMSIIIVGPRGVGKSTAAKMALKNRSHVVRATFRGDIPRFIRSVFTQVGIKEIPATTDLISKFESVLHHVKRKHNIMPKIMVGVDPRCTPEQMQELLLHIKTWGFELHLAQFVVVVSESRILPKLTISIDTLRCVCIAVGDLSKDETKVHLQEGFKLLKNMSGTSFEESEVKELVEFTEKIIGRRPMHMDNLFEELVNSRWSVEQIKDVAKFQVQRKISGCSSNLSQFKSNLRGKCETVLLEELLLKLTSESMKVYRLADCLGIDRDILLAADSTTNMAHHVSTLTQLLQKPVFHLSSCCKQCCRVRTLTKANEKMSPNCKGS